MKKLITQELVERINSADPVRLAKLAVITQSFIPVLIKTKVPVDCYVIDRVERALKELGL